MSHQQEQRDITIERRKLVRRAFDIVRFDPNRQDLRKEFSAALGGKGALDACATELARNVIAAQRPSESWLGRRD